MDSNAPSISPAKASCSARACCPRCVRAASACICALAQVVQHRTQVLILQHPQEVQHPKGTARLLHLCLPNSRLVAGEQWEASALHAWVHGAWPIDVPDFQGATNETYNARPSQPAPNLSLLLYPPTPANANVPVAEPPAWEMSTLRQLPHGAVVRLVVIDGTWRKSRKMLYLNPMLQHLPRLPLDSLPNSEYHIRKAHKPGQLSTLEATATALQQLEPQSAIQMDLMACMQRLQAHYGVQVSKGCAPQA